jgi:hypothetical protein
MSQLRYRYQNTTAKFQIIVVNSVNRLERFLLPGMSIEFEAQLEDYITIKDGYITAMFADNIPCWRLNALID